MARFSIVTTTYQSYELTRQLVESIWHYLDPNSYEKIIIVDDYSDSNGKLREYLGWLKGNEKFCILVEDEFRYVDYYQYKWMEEKREDEFFNHKKFDINKPTRGHLLSVLEGFEYVDTEFVFVMDMDTFFLAGSENLFSDLEKEFDNREKVLIAGDGLMEKSLELIEYDKINLGKSYTIDLKKVLGFVNTPACAIRTKSWKEYKIEMIRPDWWKIKSKVGEKLTGVLWDQFVPKLFEAGFHSLHYSILGSGKVLHLGRSVIKRDIVGIAPIEYSAYGFCRDWFGPYGARKAQWELEDWRSGRYFVDMNSSDYDEYLREKYFAPFDEIKRPIDSQLIKVVDFKSEESMI